MNKKLSVFLMSIFMSFNVFSGNDFWQKHAIVLFFSSQCHFCQSFEPVLEQYKQSTGASVLPYSMNGKGLPGMKKFFKPSNEMLNAAFPSGNVVYPATFIINKESLQLFQIASGALSISELSSRVDELAPKVQRYEGESHYAS